MLSSWSSFVRHGPGRRRSSPEAAARRDSPLPLAGQHGHPQLLHPRQIHLHDAMWFAIDSSLPGIQQPHIPSMLPLCHDRGSASADLGPLKRQPGNKLLDVAGCGSWQGKQKRARVRAARCGNRKSGGLACQPWPPCVESKATWRPVRDHTGRSPSCAKPRAPLCDIRDIMMG